MSAASVAVVDSWAALAYLWREGRADVAIRRYLRRAGSGNLRLVMSLVNLSEVWYRLIQTAGPEQAAEWLGRFKQLPIEWLPVREPLALEAGRIRARHRLSLADAYAVATARLERGAVLTGDPEILSLPREVVRTLRLER